MSSNKKIFKIPVSWECFGIVDIEADNLEEAIKIFDETEDTIDLPLDYDYIDGSFNRDQDEEIIRDYNNS
jgi:hypothetical protein